MTIGERIKQRRVELGLSVDELAQKLGKNRATIYRYESNEIEKLPTTVLEPLADVLGVSPGYLMGWEPEHIDESVESNIGNVLPQEKIRMIPIYESVSAGFGAYADDYIVGYMPLYIVNDDEAANTMCITVTGDSMYPKIENGDKIQVLCQNWAEDGQVVVALIDGENGVVKKIEYDDDTMRLVSFNPEYQPREFVGRERERVQILGIVKTVIKQMY